MHLYWTIIILGTWSFVHYVLSGKRLVVSLLIEGFFFLGDLFVPHFLFYPSLLFMKLAPSFSAVIGQLCCIAICFCFWRFRLSTLDLEWISAFVCLKSFFFFFKLLYGRLLTVFLLFPMSFNIFFSLIRAAWSAFNLAIHSFFFLDSFSLHSFCV